MIISCPECAGPFEVQDDRIAALVQVACPHCAFRMILDFAAANDPGLVEAGMRMASGFRSAADYHASVRAASGLAEAPAPEPEAEPAVAAQAAAVHAEPEPERATPPPRRVAGVPPVRPRPEPLAPTARRPRPVAPKPPLEPARSVGEPAREVRAPEPAEPAAEEAKTEVHMLPRGAERMAPVDIPPVRRRPPPVDEDDIAVNVPAPATEVVRPAAEPAPAVDEVSIDVDDEDEPEPATERPAAPTATAEELAAHPAIGDDDDEDAPTMIVPPEAREAARRQMDAERERIAARRARAEAAPPETAREADRVPPHTPPVETSKPARAEDERTERPARRSSSDEIAVDARRGAKDQRSKPGPSPDELLDLDVDSDQERMSTLGVVLVVILLLLAGSLVTASLLQEGTADPRPLLEKLYRQIVKGQ